MLYPALLSGGRRKKKRLIVSSDEGQSHVGLYARREQSRCLAKFVTRTVGQAARFERNIICADAVLLLILSRTAAHSDEVSRYLLPARAGIGKGRAVTR